MPDRNDYIEDLFQNLSQKYAPVDSGPSVYAETAATESGHFSTAQQLISDTQSEEDAPILDPVFAEPEKFIAGYLAPDERVGLPFPLPGPVSNWTLVSAPIVLLGLSFVPSAATTLLLYDASNTTRPALQFAIPTQGLTTYIGRTFFPHGLSLATTGGATVDGGFIVERRIDSIPR